MATPSVDKWQTVCKDYRTRVKPEIELVYRPTKAAKIVFDYEIRDTATKEVFATGHSVQVFMDRDTHQLVLNNPEFYEAWKKRWEVNE